MADKSSLEEYSPEEVAQMAATYKAILDNPATRELGLRATKTINPQTSIPEIDLKDAARGEFKKADEKMQALENKIRENDARDRVRDERDKLREAGHSKDDIAAIEKIMIDEHIPSYETAAKYFNGQRQIATPTPHVGGPATTYTMPADPLAALKGGKAQLNKWGREQATAALDDLRSGRIKLQ